MLACVVNTKIVPNIMSWFRSHPGNMQCLRTLQATIITAQLSSHRQHELAFRDLSEPLHQHFASRTSAVLWAEDNALAYKWAARAALTALGCEGSH